MQGYFAVVTIILLIAMVLFRVRLLHKKGIKAMKFGEKVFAISRNPLYTAFGLVLIGIFFIFPNWVLMIYLFAGIWLFHRQVLREEESLKKIYGREYEEYCRKVRRYL